jgi:hypothetical protein
MKLKALRLPQIKKVFSSNWGKLLLAIAAIFVAALLIIWVQKKSADLAVSTDSDQTADLIQDSSKDSTTGLGNILNNMSQKGSTALSKLLGQAEKTDAPVGQPEQKPIVGGADYTGLVPLTEAVEKLKKDTPLLTDTFSIVAYDLEKYQFRVKWLKQPNEQAFVNWLSQSEYKAIPNHYFYFVE